MCFHKWRKWKEYNYRYRTFPPTGMYFNGNPELLICSEKRQRRICLKCGKVQDEMIGR